MRPADANTSARLPQAPLGLITNTIYGSRFFLAGSIGGIAGVVAGQPFDTVKVRMQTSVSWVERFFPFTRVAHAAPLRQVIAETWATEGVRGFYRGMSSPMLGVALQKSLAFGAFGATFTALGRVWPQQPAVAVAEAGRAAGGGGAATSSSSGLGAGAADKYLPHVLLAGVAAGVANTLVLTPVDQLKICLQVAGTEEAVAAATSSEGKLTLREAARSFVGGGSHGFGGDKPDLRSSARALRAIYTAWPSTLAREAPGYAIYFATYELLSRWRRRHAPLWAVPMVGGASGLAMWACYYPLDVVKSRTMAIVAGSAVDLAAPRERPESAQARTLRRSLAWRSVAREVYAEFGVRGFYRGLTPALLRAVPTHAAVFMGAEAVLHSVETLTAAP